MPSNPMQRKIRNSFLLGITVSLLIMALIGGILYVLIIKPNLDQKQKEEQQLYAYAYRLKAGINVKSGNEIDATMVDYVKIPVENNNTDFISAKSQNPKTGEIVDVGFTGGKSKIDLKGGTILTRSMLYEEETEKSLRYVEYNMITAPTALGVGDYVDIRLRLPNGQDLIVISKKQIENCYNEVIGMNLKEEEIVLLNSAIVEAYIMPGSELYMATYVEAGIQDAAIYTYMPTNEVITLINMNENIVATARTSLATLYSKQTTVREQINGIEAQYYQDKNYEDKSSNIQAGMNEQIEAARKARESYLSELNGY